MSLWLIPIVVYLAVTLVLLGAFLFNEMSFKNPEYGIAVLFAVFWPVLIGFAVFKQLVNRQRER